MKKIEKNRKKENSKKINKKRKVLFISSTGGHLDELLQLKPCSGLRTVYLYLRIRPKVIITTGTHTAGPMCILGKLFGSKVVYIETIANTNKKTATGKLIYPIADLFIVQWEEMLKLYPKAVYGGTIY